MVVPDVAERVTTIAPFCARADAIEGAEGWTTVLESICPVGLPPQLHNKTPVNPTRTIMAAPILSQITQQDRWIVCKAQCESVTRDAVLASLLGDRSRRRLFDRIVVEVRSQPALGLHYTHSF